jgi:hypothetical protein
MGIHTSKLALKCNTTQQEAINKRITTTTIHAKEREMLPQQWQHSTTKAMTICLTSYCIYTLAWCKASVACVCRCLGQHAQTRRLSGRVVPTVSVCVHLPACFRTPATPHPVSTWEEGRGEGVQGVLEAVAPPNSHEPKLVYRENRAFHSPYRLCGNQPL